MKRILTILLILLWCGVNTAQAQPAVEWEYSYGDTSYESLFVVKTAADGGYIMGGQSYSCGWGDAWTLKTDANGTELWRKCYTSNFLYVSDIVQTSVTPEEYVFIGEDNNDLWLAKISGTNGDIIWQKHLGGASRDWGVTLQQTSDGGFVLGGVTESYGPGLGSVWIVKTDSSGNMLWHNINGTAGWDGIGNAIELSSGEFLLSGQYDYFGTNPEAFLAKYTSDGSDMWTRTYGGTGDDAFYQVSVLPDGTFGLTGHTSTYGSGGYDIWFVKTDTNGNWLGQNAYGGVADEGAGWHVVDGDHLYVTGWTASFGAGSRDGYLVKINLAGDELWALPFGGTDADHGWGIAIAADGGHVISGDTWSYGLGEGDGYLVKFEPCVEVITVTGVYTSDTLGVPKDTFSPGEDIQYNVSFDLHLCDGDDRTLASGAASGERKQGAPWIHILNRSERTGSGSYLWSWVKAIPNNAKPNSDASVEIEVLVPTKSLSDSGTHAFRVGS